MSIYNFKSLEGLFKVEIFVNEFRSTLSLSKNRAEKCSKFKKILLRTYRRRFFIMFNLTVQLQVHGTIFFLG